MEHDRIADLVLSRQAEKAKIADLNRQQEVVNLKNAAIQNDLKKARGELNNAQGEIRSLNSNIAGLKEESDGLLCQLDRKEEEIKGKEDIIRHLKAKKETQDKNMQKQLKDMADEAKRSDAQVEVLQQNLNREGEIRAYLEQQNQELKDGIKKQQESLRKDYETELAQQKETQNELLKMKAAELTARNKKVRDLEAKQTELVTNLEEKEEEISNLEHEIQKRDDKIRRDKSQIDENIEKLRSIDLGSEIRVYETLVTNEQHRLDNVDRPNLRERRN